ncbi:hypothetical protein HBN84_23480 [Pseudomonas lundensis]|nr:hypothetical protein [Pseudomonas lundensis]NNA12289.1 hypothetical protein [Pseudomonas lundensis]NNA28227.1 hypothetical protein [Pseudomonas lundensis]
MYSSRQKANEILRYGETTLGKACYTKSYLDTENAVMRPEVAGSKREMHCLQHRKILEYKNNNAGARPRLNKSDY